jgi:hypothetical protein
MECRGNVNPIVKETLMRLVKEAWPNGLGFNIVDHDHVTGEPIEVAEVMDMNENQGIHVRSWNTEKFMTFPRTVNLLGTEVKLDHDIRALVALTDKHGEDLH